MAFEEIIQAGVDFIARNTGKFVSTLIILVIGYILITITVKIVAKFFDRVDFDRAMETFIENMVKVLLWIILIIVILANIGVDVSALVAGLGIAGFVIGFALKDTLGNLASGVFILFHKPFKVNDFVDAGGVKGIVTAIGVAATSMRTPDNKMITVPNSAVWGKAITNYTGLGKRRMEIIFGISYDDNMDKAIKIIDKILKKDERVMEDPAYQIAVKELGDSSVNIVVRPWVTVADYWDLYFDLVKGIKEQFDKNKISIPYPQRDVHMKK